MATSEAEILEQYRIALHNARHQAAIAEILNEFGYGPDTLAVGEARLAAARSAFDGSRTEKSEASAAHHVFTTKKNQLIDRYALDRRKARAAFSKDPVTAKELAIVGNMPRSYIRVLEAARTFYSVSLASPEIQGRLAQMKITPEHLGQAATLLGEVETARANYLKELGEAQNATKLKDEAFAEVDDWMKEFYAIAKIALEESPQLVESLGRLVRS
jgi:hypothetical protein